MNKRSFIKGILALPFLCGAAKFLGARKISKNDEDVFEYIEKRKDKTEENRKLLNFITSWNEEQKRNQFIELAQRELKKNKL